MPRGSSLVPSPCSSKEIEWDRQNHGQRNQHEYNHIDLDPTLISYPIDSRVQEQEGDKVLEDVNRDEALRCGLGIAFDNVCYGDVRSEYCAKGAYESS